MAQDLTTQRIQSYPCKTKTQETHEKLAKVLGARPGILKSSTLDSSLEFGKACEELTWNHCTSTPHRSETYGIAERAVRSVKEGTSAVLFQSGLNESWWADSLECYTYLRNVQDVLSDGKTPYERRIGQPFKGPIIPFGSLEYHPITATDPPYGLEQLSNITLFLLARPIDTTSIWSKSLARNIPWMCIVCGWNMERRHDDRRHRRIGGHGRI